MSKRIQIIKKVVGIEGGYSNHKNDSGGKTRYGITKKVARRFGYKGRMQDLPVELAIKIYERKYWFENRLDEIELIDAKLAEEMFDTGVNCGISRSAKWFQKSLNTFNRQQKDYQDLRVDGMVGNLSIQAMKMLYVKRKLASKIMIGAMDAQQGCHYINLSQSKETQEDFTVGWFIHRIGNTETVLV